MTLAVTPKTQLSFNDHEIDLEGQMVNLTDMWRASGGEDARRPGDWKDLPSTKAFVVFIEESLADFGGNESFRVVREGGNVATWAHWQIAMAYAKYLSPAFHAWCNTVVREHMTPKPPSPKPTKLRSSDHHEEGIMKRALMRVEERLAIRLRASGHDEFALAVEADLYKLATGKDASRFLPIALHHDWVTPTAIANELGVTVNRVGRTISEMGGLRGNYPGLCKPVVKKAAHSDQEVVSYLYSPKAVAMIKEYLQPSESPGMYLMGDDDTN